MITDNEEQFIKDLLIGRFVIAIGSKGSGKSFLMTSYLMYALQNEIYKNVHFVCPVGIKGEANDSYAFLQNQKHVLIYNHYSEAVAKRVDKDRKNAKTLFMIDDASGELLKNFDNTLVQLITTTRHYKGCTIWICVHSAKKVLMPIVRQNLDHLFIYRIINMKLLQDFYDEYFSMSFDSFAEFKHFYLDVTREKNSCIHFSLHIDGIDVNVKNWQINLTKDDIILKPTKNNHHKATEKKNPVHNFNPFKRYKRKNFF